MIPLLLIGPMGPFEILVILVVGLLIFGSRLPEVGRSLGRGLMEFKKGLRGVQDEWDRVDRDSDRAVDAELERRRLEERKPPAAPQADHYQEHVAPYEPDAHEREEPRDHRLDPSGRSVADPQPDADPPSCEARESDSDKGTGTPT